jgi:hypothetical protein
MTDQQQTQALSMAFLHDYALDKQRRLSEDEQHILDRTKILFQQADEISVYLGGKAGRLGECIVETGLLNAMLQALQATGKAGIQVTIFVDGGVIELFNELLYQHYYWPQIHIIASTTSMVETDTQQANGKHRLAIDFHGGHDGMPILQVAESDTDSSRSLLAYLFRVGVRSYAQRGPVRRYADFIEELFSLPQGTIESEKAQPGILLAPEDEARYAFLSRELHMDSEAIQIVCFFQSVVLAKCYERWDEVMQLLCEYLAQHSPAQKVDFLIACGPDNDVPEGFKKADIEEWLQPFTGVNNNARVLVCSLPSLRDLALLIKHATLVLANDTGPGHIAGALGIHTVTPYLPGNIYSKQVWSSTLWHHGVTLEQHTLTYRELEAAVLWGKTDIINSIPPQDLHTAIQACLPLTRLFPQKKDGEAAPCIHPGGGIRRGGTSRAPAT